jgi:hypothetical protein
VQRPGGLYHRPEFPDRRRHLSRHVLVVVILSVVILSVVILSEVILSEAKDLLLPFAKADSSSLRSSE